MFVKVLAKTEMWGFWQYMFDLCNESFPCVLGWLPTGQQYRQHSAFVR